jgi:hypothetical protein
MELAVDSQALVAQGRNARAGAFALRAEGFGSIYWTSIKVLMVVN